MTLLVQDVSKVYATKSKSVNALEPTSLSVQEREFVTFLGPSGCGKSTLLSIISGLEEATSGSVILDGKEITESSFDIGMVFQQYTLFPWLNVMENACFASTLACNGARGQLDNDRPRNIYNRAERFLELVGLKEFKDSYPSELSGGMKQRLAIARALANRPKLLLMDEPFAALDSATREEMQDMIKLLAQLEKTTIVFVTHDVEEAIYLSDRIFVFSPRPGRLTDEIEMPFGQKRDVSLKLDSSFLEIKKSLLNRMSSCQEPAFRRDKLLALLDSEEKNLP